MEIYQTKDMEGAIRSLTDRYRHVIAFVGYFTRLPIRFRGNLLVDLPCHVQLCQDWTRRAKKDVEKWQDKGGLLIYYWRGRYDTTPPPCDALLFVESPLRKDNFETLSKDVRHETVIYMPPSWESHLVQIERRSPWPQWELMKTIVEGAKDYGSQETQPGQTL